jgi:hypothetical protein
MVKTATVIGWHHRGFGLFWSWKIRRGGPGRPWVPKEVRALIRTMSRENPLWGAPNIHGELLKLGIDVGETSVSKFMIRRGKPRSPTWRTFLENHLKTMVSVFRWGNGSEDYTPERWKTYCETPSTRKRIANAFREATTRGYPLEDGVFSTHLESILGRRLTPNAVGRPRKHAALAESQFNTQQEL